MALGAAFFLICAGLLFAGWLEKRHIPALAMEASMQKDFSVAWQRLAFAQPDILPLYGSSELVRHIGNEPQQFFASYPTGFAVSPVGRGGCTSLNLAEKIAAAGVDATPGHKMAICLSPVWFYQYEPHHRWYVGNFSPRQASALIFGPRLSLELKRQFARRMLAYPDSVEHEPLLSFALHRLVGNTRSDAMLYRAAAMVGRVGVALESVCDRLAFAGHILFDAEAADVPRRQTQALDWESILASASGMPAVRAKGLDRFPPRFSDSAAFLASVSTSREWEDMELLLRTARELQLDPLLIGIPIEYEYYEAAGVSRAALDVYGQRLRELARRYDVPLVDFPEHRHDAAFFADHNDHFSALGWLSADRALDAFFHAPPRR